MGQENSLFFTYLFLHRLPGELRVQLTNVDHADRRLLVDRVDQLWAHYAKHCHSTVACLDGASSDDESDPIAAILRQGPGSKHFGGKTCQKKGSLAPWVGAPSLAARGISSPPGVAFFSIRPTVIST